MTDDYGDPQARADMLLKDSLVLRISRVEPQPLYDWLTERGLGRYQGGHGDHWRWDVDALTNLSLAELREVQGRLLAHGTFARGSKLEDV